MLYSCVILAILLNASSAALSLSMDRSPEKSISLFLRVNDQPLIKRTVKNPRKIKGKKPRKGPGTSPRPESDNPTVAQQPQDSLPSSSSASKSTDAASSSKTNASPQSQGQSRRSDSGTPRSRTPTSAKLKGRPALAELGLSNVPTIKSPPPDSPISSAVKSTLPSPPRRTGPGTKSSSQAGPSSSRGPRVVNKIHSPGHFELMANPPPARSYQDWLSNQRQVYNYVSSFERTNIKPNMEELMDAEKAKLKASRDMKLADSSRKTATVLSNTHRATSPVVMRAMMKSTVDAKLALASMDDHITKQSNALVQAIATTHQDHVPRLAHASSRQSSRARSRQAYEDAFTAKYGARFAKQIADERKPGSPTRGELYGHAARMTMTAQNEARKYRAYYGEYRNAIDKEFAGGSSSSDDEWPLKDSPRRR